VTDVDLSVLITEMMFVRVKRFVQTASSISYTVNKNKLFSTGELLHCCLTDIDFKQATSNI